MDKALTVGSLFSGIGGLDLGLERAGMNVIWQSEIDPYACRVLNKHWPKVPNYGDITKLEWSTVARPDVICGGYPCQPFSLTGKRQGEQDTRHLWPYVRYAISQLRPAYLILENVPGHISLGLDRVLADITALGYDAEWQIISAAAVGATHIRERVFIVAYPNDARGRTPERTNNGGGSQSEQKRQIYPFIGPCGQGNYVAYPHVEFMGKRGLAYATRQAHRAWNDYAGRETPNGVGQWWQIEPDVGRVANGIPARVDRLRALGNAVVPQVAEVIGRLVIEHARNG